MQGLSEVVVNLLLEGTRTATDLAYSTAWKHWVHWCNRRDEDPLSNDLVKILEFLAHLFHSGIFHSGIFHHQCDQISLIRNVRPYQQY